MAGFPLADGILRLHKLVAVILFKQVCWTDDFVEFFLDSCRNVSSTLIDLDLATQYTVFPHDPALKTRHVNLLLDNQQFPGVEMLQIQKDIYYYVTEDTTC